MKTDQLMNDRYKVREEGFGYRVYVEAPPLFPFGNDRLSDELIVCWTSSKNYAESIAQMLNDSPVAGPWDY